MHQFNSAVSMLHPSGILVLLVLNTLFLPSEPCKSVQEIYRACSLCVYGFLRACFCSGVHVSFPCYFLVPSFVQYLVKILNLTNMALYVVPRAVLQVK